MTVIRVAFPAVVGAVLAFSGVQQILNTSRYSFTADVLGEVRSGILPLAVGAALLITALAIARRSRGGRLLGLAAALLFAAAGVALVAIEIPYLEQGGLGAALASPLIVVGGAWTLASVGYGVGMWRARSAFASRWDRDDRRAALALSVLIVVASGLFAGVGVMQEQATAEGEGNQAEAEALVAATSFEVRVVDAQLGQAPAAGASPVVERLALELTFRSPQAYGLLGPPTLCLIDHATYLDPGFKPGTFCWGGAGDALVIGQGFAGLAMAQGSTTVGLQLERSGSICAFAAGPWSAEITISPRLATDTAGGSAAPREPVRIYASFTVDGAAPGATAVPCTGLP